MGRGRATKEDGRLSPELRAAVAPRRRRGPCGGRKIALTHVETLPQPRASVRTSTTGRRDPTGRQRASEGKGKNGLQRGRSRVSSTRKPALLRTEEPSPEDPEEPSKAQDLRSRVGTRSGAPGDLGCTISR
ncbi:hypothetical protein NDU88_001400 [Pleurodeles waltl]|uniref:Uncharacterized protein n=1 Tax=Pleurodeles waltl TaxID=8319 RepID=A0AAV7NAN1_PLEWA|nr:hypothetical protein NDU88_001400 [Pleurodeles waltl]